MRIDVARPGLRLKQKPEEYVYYQLPTDWWTVGATTQCEVAGSTPAHDEVRNHLKLRLMKVEEVASDLTTNGGADGRSAVKKGLAPTAYLRVSGGVAGAVYELKLGDEGFSVHVSSL